MVVIRCLCVSLLAIFLAAKAHAVELSMACPTSTADRKACQIAVELYEKQSSDTVKLVTVPANSTQALGLYQQMFAAESSALDVMQIDTVWQKIMAPYLLDLEADIAGREGEWFAQILANNTVNGKLVSLPAWADMGLLYYRKDLLEKYGKPVPGTWRELTQTAQFIQDAERRAGNTKIWGFVFQGRAYEGLTCAALEWVHSFGGGAILSGAGQATINNQAAVSALTLAASWVGTITPPGVLTYAEEDARGVFQQGDAVFMRNWTYAWSLLEAPESLVTGKVGYAYLPAGDGGSPTSTLGGWSYGVSRFSAHPQEAQKLALFLASPTMQKIRAMEASRLPAMSALYDDPELKARSPFIASLGQAVLGTVARPASVSPVSYYRISQEFFDGVHAILSGSIEPQPGLERLQRRLQGLISRADALGQQ
jgi:trehalose/maltose transport system substrate-binding protein